MPLLQPTQPTPQLEPLANSNAVDDYEAQIKALFIAVFEAMLRPAERRINVFGAPHLGDFELVERNIKRDGLSLYRGADEGAMRYLYKAWRSRNPRRGLAFTRCYLQLLFPNNWDLHQLWQDKSQPYPTKLQETDGGNHFLTSRIRIEIGSAQNTAAVIAVVSALRSTLPARILAVISIRADDIGTTTAGAANGCAGLLVADYGGTIR